MEMREGHELRRVDCMGICDGIPRDMTPRVCAGHKNHVTPFALCKWCWQVPAYIAGTGLGQRLLSTVKKPVGNVRALFGSAVSVHSKLTILQLLLVMENVANTNHVLW